MNRCVIVGGAPIGDYAALRGYIGHTDFVIYCDCGLRHMEGLQAAPSMIVGDFDSHENPHIPVETAVLPHMKDETDSFYAVKAAYERGFREFLLLGVFGGRMDHTLANVYMLLWLYNRGCKALAADDYSDFEICGRAPVYIDGGYEYFSLIALEGQVTGICITDALYTLENGTIDSEFQIGVSNEPLEGKTACVRAESGHLLIIKDRK